MIKRLATMGAVLLAGCAAVVGIKTVGFAPEAIADAKGIDLAPAVAVDRARAAERLGAAIRFQTVSHQLASDNRPEEWGLHHFEI